MAWNPEFKLLVLTAAFLAVTVPGAIVVWLSWRWVTRSPRPGEVLSAVIRQEYQPLLDSGALRQAPSPSLFHQVLEGEVEGCRVRIEMLYGEKKGLRVTRTEATLASPAPLPFELQLYAPGTEASVTASGAHAAHVSSCLGEAAQRLAAFARERGAVRIDASGASWVTPSLTFGGSGAATLTRLARLTTDVHARLAGCRC